VTKEMSEEYGYVPEKIAIHSKHLVHYWVGQKDGIHLKCGCGAVKNKNTGKITYDT
jgi:hypothetical protein